MAGNTILRAAGATIAPTTSSSFAPRPGLSTHQLTSILQGWPEKRFDIVFCFVYDSEQSWYVFQPGAADAALRRRYGADLAVGAIHR